MSVILATLAVLAVILVGWRKLTGKRAIPTPVPQSVGARLNTWRQESIIDMVWQAVIVVLAIVVAYALAGAGGLFVVLAFITIYFFFQDPIHDAFADIWERDFWRVGK